MGIKKIEHTALIVKNLEESIEFYEQLLNFQLRTTGNTGNRKLAFLNIKDHPEVEIELIEELTETESPYINGVIDHIAFAVEDMEETIKDLQSKGVSFLTEKPSLTAFGKKNILFKGLNGELLQLIEM
nr:VOC family protein [Lysinibacillus timonensis]